MKQATIVIDHDELDEILREHMAGMFPALEIESIFGLSYGDVTVRLRKPLAHVDPAPETPPDPAGDPKDSRSIFRSTGT